MNPPAFQLYASDFLAATSEMTAEEVGVYFRLLLHQWIKGGIPDDDNRLMAMAGQCQASSLAYAKTKFGKCEDGALRQGRMEREREKQRLYREKQAVNGAKRWLGNAKPDAKPHASAEPSQMPNACSSSSSSSSSLTSTSQIQEIGDSPNGKRVKTERNPPGGLEEVKAFFVSEKSTEAKALDFWDWYEGNGWTQGRARTPLKNWKNAANRWIRNEINRSPSSPTAQITIAATTILSAFFPVILPPSTRQAWR